MYNRAQVEFVLEQCGWKLNKLVSSAYNGKANAYTHPIMDEMFIKVDAKEWRMIPSCSYRYGMGVMHKKSTSRKRYERNSTDLAYGTSTASLIEKLMPAVITTKPEGILPESHVPAPRNWGRR
jgi:hypothetical protein